MVTGGIHIKSDVRADVPETVVSTGLLLREEIRVGDTVVVHLNLLHFPSSLLAELQHHGSTSLCAGM